MEYGQDGMRVEYSTNGINFSPLGSYNDPNGINWYDNASVVAFGNVPAYSGSSVGWKQASYNTTAFSGSSFIQYAFVFRSDVNLSGDGVSVDDFELTSVVGLPELDHSVQLLLQPNPVKNILSVTINAEYSDNLNIGETAIINITDVIGKSLIKKSLTCTSKFIKAEVDVSMLSRGVYMLCLQTSKGNIVKKFVKQ